MKKSCVECKNEITGKYVVVASIEKEDFGEETYYCYRCARESLMKDTNRRDN